jgi:hypothetical protein
MRLQMLEVKPPRSIKWSDLRTRWTILDYFIERLAEEGDEICNDNTIKYSDYRGLQSLVCNGNTNVLETFKLGPNYHFILISYYILFHKKNFDLAYKIFQKIYETYEDDKILFNDDEERSLHYLKLVFEKLEEIRNYCSNYKPGSGYLAIALKNIAIKLRKTKDAEKDTWSTLLKDLLIIHLDPSDENEFKTMISRIKRTIKKIREEEEVLSGDIAKGYNIFSGELSMAPYYFIYYMFQKADTTLSKEFHEHKKYIESREFWKKVKNFFEKISGKFTKIEDIVSNDKVSRFFFTISSAVFSALQIDYLGMMNEILKWLLIIIPLIWPITMSITIAIATYIRYIEKKINSFIEKNILKDIYVSICGTK